MKAVPRDIPVHILREGAVATRPACKIPRKFIVGFFQQWPKGVQKGDLLISDHGTEDAGP